MHVKERKRMTFTFTELENCEFKGEFPLWSSLISFCQAYFFFFFIIKNAEKLHSYKFEIKMYITSILNRMTIFKRSKPKLRNSHGLIFMQLIICNIYKLQLQIVEVLFFCMIPSFRFAQLLYLFKNIYY